jgi:hypothetical protein
VNGAIDKMFSNKPSKKAKAEDELHRLLSKFVNNAGLADNVVTNPHLRKAVDFAINNANDLKNYTHLGKRKHIILQCKSFDELIAKVTGHIEECRQWYFENTGSRQRFISVAHDVWDGKRRKILGASLLYADPESLETYRIPIVLTPPGGNSSLVLCNTSMHGLERVKVTFEDLFRAINDNCPTAVKQGRL